MAKVALFTKVTTRHNNILMKILNFIFYQIVDIREVPLGEADRLGDCGPDVFAVNQMINKLVAQRFHHLVSPRQSKDHLTIWKTNAIA